jgi:hypothetical protein
MTIEIPNEERLAFGLREAAAAIGVSPKLIHKAIQEHELPYRQKGLYRRITKRPFNSEVQHADF